MCQHKYYSTIRDKAVTLSLRKPTGQSRYYIHWHSNGKLLKTSTGTADKAEAKKVMYVFDPDQYEAQRNGNGNGHTTGSITQDNQTAHTDATSPDAPSEIKTTASTIGDAWNLFIEDRSNGTGKQKTKTIKHYQTAYNQLHKYYLKIHGQDISDIGISFLDRHPGVDRNQADELRDMFNHFFKSMPSNATAQKYRSALSSFYGFLLEKRYVRLNLFLHREGNKLYIKSFTVKPQSQGWFTKEELDVLVNNLDADEGLRRKDNKPVCRYTYMSHQLLKDIYIFCAYTGIRAQEMIHLKFEDIDWTNRYINVRRDSFQDYDQWTTKTALNRTVPLNDIPYQILQRRFAEREAWKENHKEDTDTESLLPYVFTTHNHSKMVREIAIADKTSNLCKQLFSGLTPTDKSFHSLRHSFATWLAKAGTPVPVISQMLGHTNLKTTETYIHVEQKDAVDAVASL